MRLQGPTLCLQIVGFELTDQSVVYWFTYCMNATYVNTTIYVTIMKYKDSDHVSHHCLYILSQPTMETTGVVKF